MAVDLQTTWFGKKKMSEWLGYPCLRNTSIIDLMALVHLSIEERKAPESSGEAMTHDVVLHSVRGPDEEAEAADEQGALLLHEGVRPREEEVGRSSMKKNYIVTFHIIYSGPNFNKALFAGVFEYYAS